MDNPWANNWGDSTHSLTQAHPPEWKPTISSTVPTDDEADITAPAWKVTPPSSPHDEPSLWSQSAALEPDLAWGRSRFDDILNASRSFLGAEEYPQTKIHEEIEKEESHTETETDAGPSTPSDETDTVSSESDDRHLNPASPSPGPSPVIQPPSPDAFGSFETATLDPTSPGIPDDPWSPSQAAFAVDSAGSWGDIADTGPLEEEPTASIPPAQDEWEAAQQQKERHDREVSPELIQEIQTRFRELFTKLPQPEQAPDPENLPGLHQGLYGVSGLMDTAERLIPEEYALSQPTPFASSFAAKSMAESLKLTRHVPFLRSSPMSYFMSAKGSTAWEISVRSRPEVSQDDIIPKGWKSPEPETPVEAAPENKPTGGLLSFFGRKATNPPTANAKARASLPATQSPASSQRASLASSKASPRSSIDVHKSGTPPKVATPPPPSASTSSNPPTRPSSISSPQPPLMEESKPSADVFPEIQPAAPPSAVSRFLNRFSRSKSERSSMALSSDDLEFLSDIVQTAGDEDDQPDDFQLKALSSMIQSSPLPTKLPPPLPPPPQAPPPRVIPPKALTPVPRQISSPTVLSPTIASQSSAPSLTQAATSSTWSNAFDYPTIPSTPTMAPRASPSSPPLPPPPASSPPPSAIQTNSYDAFASMDDMFGSTPSPTVQPSKTRTFLPHSAPSTQRGAQRPPQKRTTITAIMSSNSHSATSSTSSSVFSLPPPPVLAPPKSVTPVPLIPGPGPSKVMVSTKQPALVASPPLPDPPSLMGDDDDFSDFHTGETAAPVSIPTASSGDWSTGNGDSGLSTSFGDFNDFVSSGLSNTMSSSTKNSPPDLSTLGQQPPKSPFGWIKPAGTTPSGDGLPSTPLKTPISHKRTGSRVDESQHQRTQSLLDIASSRKGQWPAPPSPLPPAIPPPSSKSQESDLDFFGSSSGVEASKANGVGILPSVFESQQQQQQQQSAVAPLGNSSIPSMDFGMFSPTSSVSSPLAQKGPANSQAQLGNKGLSAQDLSFFEGL